MASKSVDGHGTTLAAGTTVAFSAGAEVALDSATIASIGGGATSQVSTNNSTTLALAGAATYTGTYEDVSDFSTISVLIIINTGSNELGTLHMDQAVEEAGTNVRTKSIVVGNTATSVHTLTVISQYLRIRFVADQGTACNGALQTIYNKHRSKHLTSFISETITEDNDCEVVRAVLTGATDGGQFKNTRVDSSGNIGVRLHGPVTAFGEVMTAMLTPRYQLSFPNNTLNAQLYEQFTATGGTITALNGVATLATTTSIGSYATLRSKRAVIYRAGQGAECRFTAAFNAGVATSTQQAGPGNSQSALAFGYDGTSFGVLRSTGGLIEIRQLTVTTAATGGENATITLNGTGFTVPLTNAGGSKEFTAYEISKYASYTGWYTEQVDDKVIFTFAGVGAKAGVFSMTSATAAGTFSQLAAGGALTNNWTAQASWNIDPCDGTGPSGFTINPQLGNVYRIAYQWLGFGAITFSVENPVTGEFIPVHIVRYANTAVVPSLTVPTLRMSWACASLGSTTAMTLKTSSGAGFIQGPLARDTNAIYSADFNKTTISGNTETNVLVIRNMRAYNGTYNHSEIILRSLSIAVDGSKVSRVRVYLNATTIGAGTTGDYPDWNYIDQVNSAVLLDTKSITHTGGTKLLTTVLAKAGSEVINFTNLGIILQNSDTLTVTCESTAATDCAVGVIWDEER